MPELRRQPRDFRKLPSLQSHKAARDACCPRCGAGPGMACVSLNQKRVRPHVERMLAWEEANQ
jgi:hypothetical protein